MDFGALFNGIKNAVGGFVGDVGHALGLNNAPQPQQPQAPRPNPVLQQPQTPQQPTPQVNLPQLAQGMVDAYQKSSQPLQQFNNPVLQPSAIHNPIVQNPVRQAISQHNNPGAPQAPDVAANAALNYIKSTPAIEAKNSAAMIVNPKTGKPEINPNYSPLSVAGSEENVAKGVMGAAQDVENAIPKNPTKVNPFLKAAGDKASILNSMGQHGKAIVNVFNQQFNDKEVMQQGLETALKPFFDLGKAAQETVRDVLNGVHEGPIEDPKVKNAITSLQQTMPKVQQMATGEGLDIGNLGENYFPRVTDWSKIPEGSPTWNDTIQRMVDEGQAPDLATAAQNLEDARNRAVGYYKSGNLMQSRVREDELPQLPAGQALSRYLTGASDTITKAHNFGPQSEVLNDHLNGLMQEGHDGKTAREIVRQVVNPKQSNKVLANIRGVGGFLQLSKAAISHSTQLVNTATVNGFGKTASGLNRFLFSPEERDFARSTGVYKSIHGITEQTGLEGALGRGTAPALGKVMQFNRGVTAVAGRYAARAAAAAGDVGQLVDRFGLDASKLVKDSKGAIKLSPEQEVQAARKLVQDTMFRSHPLDTPMWAETNAGKFVGQYRMAYSYKQTGFIYKQVINEARKGNLAPLLRFVIGAPIATGVMLEAKHLLGGQAPTPSNIATGSTGIPGEVAAEVPYAKQGGAPAAEAVAGEVAPLAGTAVQTGVNAGYAAGGDVKPLEREGLSSIPVIGTALSHQIVPPASPATIAYANALTKAGQGLDQHDASVLKTVTTDMMDPQGHKTSPGTVGDYQNANTLLGNYKLGGKVLQQYYQAMHSLKGGDPMWQLPLTAPAGKPSVMGFLQYEATPMGKERTGMKERLQGVQATDTGSGWIDNLQTTRNAYFSKLPPSQSAQNRNEPAYPNFAPQTTADLKTAQSITSSTDYDKFISNHPDVVDAQITITQWQNKIDSLEQGIPLNQVQTGMSPQLQAIVNHYDSLPPSKSAGNTDPNTQHLRSDWIKANPGLYNQMANYYASEDGKNLLNDALEAVYSGQNMNSQSLLKAASETGSDIAKGANGQYSVNPAAAYAASSSSSSSSSSPGEIHMRFTAGKPKIFQNQRLKGGVRFRFNPPRSKPAKRISPTEAPPIRQQAPKNGGAQTTNDTIRTT